ncbi:murein hydrolase activator EnvC family protein [Bathymodiolus septemdierum thioautotrophic gill symbiont]|uniref:Lipoprotein NlpD n=1 Tax=endosymbiont of Bathymodiolus septemdierum str. Myojin knoll TaxID=1303921 RepID=A0A0P0UT72_9GAMM|nr:M23 family metallopeptidase [Bathymodiolus septemdierum thioautotrophic gill symbiont]BAS68081.1 lipoprotein NlpD [endosymbiont of Bathymodiolus septemdierum str. Myojin knoll]
MLKHIKFFTVIFISATLIGCFSDGQRKRVIIIDKSTSVENISPNRLPNLVQPKKTVTKTHKKINKKPLTNKTIIKRKKELLPVTGKVIKSFSKKNQGITIATQPGQAVHAIRKGIVVYSGKIKRHGKMIIIKHALGFYSTYTQNQTLKVQSGDKVTKGQIIALTGKNNFYFEMKKFETPIDPLKYLK